MAAWRKDLNVELDDEKQSRINSAGIINITLENLWRESYSAMSKGNYSTWNTKLDSIWAILGGDVAEGSDKDKLFNAINLKIYSHGSLNANIGKGFGQKINPKSPLIYQYLLRKALFLRRLQNEQGKGTAYANEDDSDLD